MSFVSQANVELVLRGYRAFVEGDFATVSQMLDPDIQWSGVEPEGSAGRDDVLEIIAKRFADGHRLEIERCVGVGDRVVVYFRASETVADPDDDRPLQTRRSYTIGRYAGVITIRDGRVVRVEDYPTVHAALEAVGLADQFS